MSHKNTFLQSRTGGVEETNAKVVKELEQLRADRERFQTSFFQLEQHFKQEKGHLEAELNVARFEKEKEVRFANEKAGLFEKLGIKAEMLVASHFVKTLSDEAKKVVDLLSDDYNFEAVFKVYRLPKESMKVLNQLEGFRFDEKVFLLSLFFKIFLIRFMCFIKE